MNRGSQHAAPGILLAWHPFNEAPIHESGKSCDRWQRKAAGPRLQ